MGQSPSHYLNQWWLVYWRIYASLGLNELREYRTGLPMRHIEPHIQGHKMFNNTLWSIFSLWLSNIWEWEMILRNVLTNWLRHCSANDRNGSWTYINCILTLIPRNTHCRPTYNAQLPALNWLILHRHITIQPSIGTFPKPETKLLSLIVLNTYGGCLIILSITAWRYLID